MIVAHGDAPVSHPTLRVSTRYLCKSLFGFLILEGMKPCDSAIELRSRSRTARDLKAHASEFFAWFVPMNVRTLRIQGSGAESEYKQQSGDRRCATHTCPPLPERNSGSRLILSSTASGA